MFDLVFFAIPTAVIGYGATLFVIMKFMGEELHDVSETSIAQRCLLPKETQTTNVLLDTADATRLALQESWSHGDVALRDHMEHIPTDSMLKRHYLTHLHSLALSLYSQPEESMLRRHHAQLIERLVEEMCQNPERIEDFNEEILERARSVSTASSSSNSIARKTQSETLDPPEVNPLVFPEDSVLRRHALQLVTAQFEAIYPKPSESTLLRHYSQWLETKLEALIEESNPIAEVH